MRETLDRVRRAINELESEDLSSMSSEQLGARIVEIARALDVVRTLQCSVEARLRRQARPVADGAQGGS